MSHWVDEIDWNGQWTRHEFESGALRSNALGDPLLRPIWVYAPPSYSVDTTRHYPTVYVIQGFSGTTDMWWNLDPFRKAVPTLIDELFGDPEVNPALVVLVDAWTSLGGSQYLNSPATGNYLDYLCDDVVNFVDNNYRTLATAKARALTGKSSGGYGAMVVPQLRPGIFGALASHAGDALFEWCYGPDLAQSARALRDEYQGDIANFLSRPTFSFARDAALINTYAMAACYSPDPNGQPILPFDPETTLIRDEVWERWLALDPVRLAPLHREELETLSAIWVDAGRSDQYFLDLGASAFSARLRSLGIDHHFELFSGTHYGIEFRYPLAIRYLVEHLSVD